MFSVGIANSQEVRTEMQVNFRVNGVAVDTAYAENAANVQEIISFLEAVRKDPSVELLQVAFCGAASPEGSAQLNNKLASKRLASLESLVRSQIYIPEDLIIRDDQYIPWNYLREKVATSNIQYKYEILNIIDEMPRLVPHHYPGRMVDHRIIKLKELDRGSAWLDMYELFFKDMRSAHVVFITSKNIPTATAVRKTAPKPAVKPISYKPASSMWSGEWLNTLNVKTNAIGIVLGIFNFAIEFDVAEHMSVSMPLYYSAWNYTKSTIKFRCLNFQPELRYWERSSKEGFFAGAHLGVSSYNFAFDGDYRFQDHNGVTPAVGAGVALGYRLPISSDHRWQMEFSLGAGAYALNFDVFKNTPNVKKGELLGSQRMTYVGLDQAQVSFVYAFDFKNIGGRR